MRIFNTSTLKKNWEKYPDTEQQLKSWNKVAINSDWKTPNDVKATYPNSSILQNNRVVFNIKGNSYRLITELNYAFRSIFIKWFGTHAEYDKIDANTINDN